MLGVSLYVPAKTAQVSPPLEDIAVTQAAMVVKSPPPPALTVRVVASARTPETSKSSEVRTNCLRCIISELRLLRNLRVPVREAQPPIAYGIFAIFRPSV